MDDLDFKSFFNERLRASGMSIKKLSDVSGIAVGHLENMHRGNLNALPPAPYLKGYLEKLGDVLEFDPAIWWDYFKKIEELKTSGERDSLPANRFAPRPIARYIWIGAVAVLVLVYFISRFSYIFGKPALAVEIADRTTVTSALLTLKGTVENGDHVVVDNEEAAVNSDGAWQKDVLLQSGLNTITITAKKFLGRETTVTRQIIYEPLPPATPTSTTSGGHTPAPHPTPMPTTSSSTATSTAQ